MGFISFLFMLLQVYIFIAMCTRFRCCKPLQWMFTKQLPDVSPVFMIGLNNVFYSYTKDEALSLALWNQSTFLGIEIEKKRK